MKKLIGFLIGAGVIVLSCYFLGFTLNCFIESGFRKVVFAPQLLIEKRTFVLFGALCLAALLIYLLYFYKYFWLRNSKNIIKGQERDKHILANLEQSRFQTKNELKKHYQTVEFAELGNTEIKGIPIMAKEEKKRFQITFSPPAHTLVIGTTGSGKTTTFINPSIRILAASKTMPSMFISDPKGELYQLHAGALEKRGYEVKVLDLRNPYHSVRWNPLERPFLNYRRMLNLDNEVVLHEDKGCYEFDGKTYYDPKDKDAALQVKKQQLNDMVYEDLHDITTVLCPISNKNEPMWEAGARNFVLAIALAMLEDIENEEYGLTKEKYNFYSLTKVAMNTDDDCAEMLNYFRGRSPLSKAVSLSKQVLDSSDKTRGSYLSSVFDKLSMFADLSLCALTSENEIEFGSMGKKPIALFLQVPDEKETRYTLAAMVVLQAYKELVYTANEYPDLTLPKPVYFLLDEFGNLPKIAKLEQMITVGRSRNIWLNLVVQSYAQLAKTYDDKSADIIKSNCNNQIFIGTTDYKTIEEFSKRCGNYSIVQRSVGFNSSKADDINSNTSVKERPLIYPSELQQLNCKGNMGNAIVTIFGYYPIRSKFTPSYASKFFENSKTEQKIRTGRYFDEKAAFYDVRKRNEIMMNKQSGKRGTDGKVTVRERVAEKRRAQIILEKIQKIAADSVGTILDEQEKGVLFSYIQTMQFDLAIKELEKAIDTALELGEEETAKNITEVVERLKDFERGEMRIEIK